MATPFGNVGVGGVARRLQVKPQQATQLFSGRRLRIDLYPVVCGRRIIPAAYISVIALAPQRECIAAREEEGL